MLTLFWDERGVILEHYMPKGNTDQCNVCRSPQESPASCNQVQMTWTSEYRCFVATIQDVSFECLPHPPYMPDLAPSDFHIFGPLKEAMGGKSFRSDEEVQQAMHEWLHSQPKDFFYRGIHALPKRWNTCMECSGDYVNKMMSLCSLCVQ